MAGGVNKVILVGRCARDPEVRSFANGGRVVNLRIVTSEKFKDKEGQMQERAEFHSVAIFNEKLGEIAEKYLTKGSECYIEGALATRKWTDKDGVEKYSTEVVLRQFRGEISLIGGRNSGADTDGGDRTETRQAPRTTANGGRQSGWSNDRGGGPRGNATPGKPADFDDIPFACEWR